MSAERIYRLLLRAYPPDFRAEYGREMVLLFRDQCQESDVRTVGFWAAVICDVARSAPALRAAAWRARVSETTRTIEVTMKLAAMLASLVMIVAARLLFPWMSIFSQLVGFGLPVALLIALYWPRKPSTTARLGTVLILVFGLSASAAAAHSKPGDTTRAAETVKDLPLPAAQRQSFVGIYSVTLPLGGGSVVRIFEENGVLKALSEGETRRLLYQGDAVFRPQGMPNFVITFLLEGGRATKFTGRRPELEGVMEGVRIQ